MTIAGMKVVEGDRRGGAGGGATDPPTSPGQAWVRQAVRTLVPHLCNLTVEGAENVPERGAFLLVFNHTSNFDPPLLLTAAPRSDLIGLVAASYRSKIWARFMIEASGSIWLRRGAGDRSALDAAVQALREGTPVGMSPEGGRGGTIAMRRGKPGVASIASRADVPLLPAGIIGAHRLTRAMKRFRRPPVTVRFGPPFRLGRLADRPRKQRLQIQSEEIMARVASLLPPAYRGYYAHSSLEHGP